MAVTPFSAEGEDQAPAAADGRDATRCLVDVAYGEANAAGAGAGAAVAVAGAGAAVAVTAAAEQ